MLLEKAVVIAAKAHAGQKDKGGECYLLHCLRVMLCCKKEKERIVAVLHDSIEDTDITEEYLKKEGFSKEIVEAIVCLTKKKEEQYFDYIERVKQNDIARVVKWHDLEDNMNLDRIKNITEKDRQRVEKYKKAKEMLKM